jgi:transglutaminase-like putative cysteine protease
VHPSRRADLLTPERMVSDPALLISSYSDSFGNVCHRLVAPAGVTALTSNFLVADSGLPDIQCPDAAEIPVAHLPHEALQYLLPSRYCDSDQMQDFAWKMFENVPPGWGRVQAIVDFVHNHIKFDYLQARNTRSASEAHAEAIGVCRDFSHLAITLCRSMNIPARYVTGYLGDIGVPDVPPMDFSAWMQVWLGDRWHDFDPRNNKPRIGRILMATGRDAADVAISWAFGNAELQKFEVVTHEIDAEAAAERLREVA